MSTPDFEVHRAIVHTSNTATGAAEVRIPSLLGAGQVVSIPTTGLTEVGGSWNVPTAGSTVFVAVTADRTQFLWLAGVAAPSSGDDLQIIDSLQFNTGANVTVESEGLLAWNEDWGTVDVGLHGSDAVLRLGQQAYYYAKNQTGSMIEKGTVVRFDGAVGTSGHLKIAPFLADGTYPSTYVMGIAAHDIPNGEDGYVTHFGAIRGIDTDTPAWDAGDVLYASPTVAGGMTTSIPTAPNNIVLLAAVVNRHKNNGEIFVRPTLAANILNNEGIVYTNISDNDTLTYNSSIGAFENTAFDHGNLSGLADDDHTQYLNETRHSAVDHSSIIDSAIGQSLTSTSDVTFNTVTTDGGITVGGHITPDTSVTYDLGSSTNRFRDLYLSGSTINLGGIEISSDGTSISIPTLTITEGLNVSASSDIDGNATSASTLQTARNISLTGNIRGSATFDGSSDVQIAVALEEDSITLGTETTGDYVESLVAGTGVAVSNNTGEGSTPTVAIGQDVGTTADVTFNNVTVSGNLTVSGDTTTLNVSTVQVEDNIIVVNSGQTGSPTLSGGLEVERGTESNVTLIWDETNDRWTVGSESLVAGTFVGDLTGDVTGNVTGNVVGNLTGDVTGDVTGDLTGNADTATALQTARTIGLTGDVTATGVSFDGTGNVTLTTLVSNDSVDLGTHTTGDYVESVSGGTGVTVTGGTGEGSTPTLSIGQAVGTTDDVVFNTIQGTNGVVTSTTSGAPTGTASDGTISIDTTNDEFYIRSGGAWVKGGETDHGSLDGLSDDDHTQYALADGSRGSFEASGAVSTHESATDPHPQYLTATEGNAAYESSGSVSNHNSATTNVHGIADTSALLDTGDIGTTVQGYSSVLGATTASYTTAEETKLAGIAAGAEVNTVDSVNSQTGAVVLDADDIDDTSTTNKFTTSADISKLAGIETGATADQTASEILTAIKTVDGTGSGLDADTLDGSHASDFATSAQGTLADSALQSSDIGVSVQGYSSVLDGTTASFTTAEETKLAGIAAGAEVNVVDSVNSQTGTVVLDADDIDDTSTTHKFTTASDITKLSGIETGATADQSASEVPVIATGNLSSTDVQAALQELQGDIDSLTTMATPDNVVMGNYSGSSPANTVGNDGDYAVDISDGAVYGPKASGAWPGTPVGDFIVATNLGNTRTSTTVTVTSSDGTDTTIASADGSNAGVMSAADYTKLSGIETGATADQSASEILTAIKTVDGTGSGLDADTLDGQHASSFEASGAVSTHNSATTNVHGIADTSALLDTGDIGVSVQGYSSVLDATTASYTTAEETKLAGIEAGAEVNTVDSVNSQTGAVVLDADDIDDTSTTNKFVTASDITKLSNLSGINTGDQDLSSYQLQPSEGAFANGDKTKLDGIEAGADVTDATNVESAIESITLTSVSGDTGDEILIVDATDGGLKSVLWQNLPSGGSGSPGGSDGQIQYNNSGAFGGALSLVYDAVNGRVGIGTNSPNRNLHIQQTSSGATAYNLTGGIDIETDNISGLNILSPNNGYGRIYFGSPVSNTAGAVEYIHNATLASGYMKIRAGGADRIYIHGNGNIGINQSTPSYTLDVNGTGRFTDNLTVNGNQIVMAGVATRDKYRVWDSSLYCIGMDSAYTFGALDDYAMTFQMNNNSNRGFWWGDDAHGKDSGAMSLSTDGHLYVANSIKVGFGETNTSNTFSYGLEVSGEVRSVMDGTSALWYNQALQTDSTGQRGGIGMSNDNSNNSTTQLRPAAGYLYVRSYDDSTGHIMRAASYQNYSTLRDKQDIIDWGATNSVGAAVDPDYAIDATEMVRNLRPVKFKRKKHHRLSADIRKHNERRERALNRLNEYRRANGMEDFVSDETVHQCGRDCDGSEENPCKLYRDWDKGEIGFIAEEVVNVNPDAVWTDDDEQPLTIDPMAMITMCVKALKEIDARLTTLETS